MVSKPALSQSETKVDFKVYPVSSLDPSQSLFIQARATSVKDPISLSIKLMLSLEIQVDPHEPPPALIKIDPSGINTDISISTSLP
eukprot:jgi/Psemu1/47627/gm1.47627_g